MKKDIKTEKELTEELENIYRDVATENSDNLSTLVEDLPGYPVDATYDAEDESNNESDNAPDRKQKEGKKSGSLRIGIVGLMGILIIMACVFFFTLGLREKSPSQNKSPVLIVETFRAPITAIPEDHTSTEATEPIKTPNVASKASTSEEETEPPKEVTSDSITPSENVKITEAEEIQPLPDISEEKPYTIQIRAFKTRRAAEALAKKFIEKGFDAHWEKVILNGGDVWYRAFIGHFSSRETAQAFMKNLYADGSVKEGFIRNLK
ncbi:MAG: SPOR domain-containing protein [Thermodesulfobacteriota bacterium]|nr:SPOR domain-containing protein [Thermodesulfobacteriota bacterium]